VASLASLFVCGSVSLRRRALRPQLKRDSLGRCYFTTNHDQQARTRRRLSPLWGPADYPFSARQDV
jgi:hypothetical protein